MTKCAFLIIGDEILCGKTRDSNLQTLAIKLGEKGYEIGEVRIVNDAYEDIINAVNELRKKYLLVFTSGGIGPTHDDITSEAISRAFNVEYSLNEEAERILIEYYKEKNLEFNLARRKMAFIPKGANLIANPISKAPAFKIDNVCVMAGIPSIFSAMLDEFLKTLPEGKKIYNLAIESTMITEGMIAIELGQIQKKYLGIVFIGSYPSILQNGTHNLKLTFRSTDFEKCNNCKNECETLFENINGSKGGT